MIETLKELDERLFLHLNSIHADWLNGIMHALSGTAIWFPFYAVLIYFIIRKYQKSAFWYILGIVVLILLADQFTSAFMKPYFERLRPCHDPRWEGLINNYSGCGGRYGFASSHASNTFALATFICLLFKNPLSRWMFVWAAVISYTRIYLGVHYPADVLVGGLLGIVFALLVFWALTRLLGWWSSKGSPANQSP